MTLLATAHLDSGAQNYAQTIHVGRHTIEADEHAELGGTDAGATPYGLLLSALAACTAITLQMYAGRKGWDIGALHIDVAMTRDEDVEKIERSIKVQAQVTPEQRTRLGEIAEKTPVTKTLKRATTITTTIV